MRSNHLVGIAFLVLCLGAFSACDGQDTAANTDSAPFPTADSVDTIDDGDETPATDATETTDGEDAPITGVSGDTRFTHKMMKSTGENLMASLAYECPQCSFEQWLSIEPPEGWSKGPAQVIAFTSGEMRSKPSFDDVPSAVDFLDEIPGEEYELIAKNLDGRIIESKAGRMVVEAQVMRDTVLRWDAGKRVHELTDPEGNIFVLFTYQVDPENVVIPDFEDPYLMGLFIPPEGWTYTSRVLEEELVLDTPDVATVLAIRGEMSSTWEKRQLP